MDVTRPTDTVDGECTLVIKASKFDLVVTLEVAEHIDPTKAAAVLDILAAATGKFLVFAAARPEQGGTGHISLQTRAWYIEQFELRGLRHLPSLSQIARESAYKHRPYDLFHNLVVFTRNTYTDDGAKDTEQTHPLVYAQYGDPTNYQGFGKDPVESSKHFRDSKLSFVNHDMNGGVAAEAGLELSGWFIPSTLWPRTHFVRRHYQKLCAPALGKDTGIFAPLVNFAEEGVALGGGADTPSKEEGDSQGTYAEDHATYWADRAFHALNGDARVDAYTAIMAVTPADRKAKALELLANGDN